GPDARPRRVQGTAERNRVGRVVYGLQVADDVAPLAPFVEPRAADDLIWNASAPQRIFQGARLGVRAVQNDDVAARTAARHPLLRHLRHTQRFLFLVDVEADANRVAALPCRPQRLALATLVVRVDVIGGVEDRGGRAVVLLEPYGLGAAEAAIELQDVLDAGAAPAVDRLVVVADDEQVAVRARQVLDERHLDGVRVLEFVDEH